MIRTIHLLLLGAIALSVGCYEYDPGTDPWNTNDVSPPQGNGIYVPSANCSVHVGGEGWTTCNGTTNCAQYNVGAVPVNELRQIRLSLSNDCDHSVVVTMGESAQPSGSVDMGGGGGAPDPNAPWAKIPLEPQAYEQLDPYVRPLQPGDFVLQCNLFDEADTTVAHGMLRIVGAGY